RRARLDVEIVHHPRAIDAGPGAAAERLTRRSSPALVAVRDLRIATLDDEGERQGGERDEEGAGRPAVHRGSPSWAGTQVLKTAPQASQGCSMHGSYTNGAQISSSPHPVEVQSALG